MPVVLRATLAAGSIALAQTHAVVARAEGPSKRECVAASETGQGLRSAGRLRDARTKFRECVSQSCPRPVREDCAQRVAEMETAIPTLVLAAKDLAGNDLLAVAVRVDGQSLADPLGGKAIEVDPGEHQFTFQVEGEPPVEKSVVVRQGDKNRLIQVVIGQAPSPPLEPVAPKPAAPPHPPPVSDDSTWRLAGITLGAVGVGAAGAGLVLSLLAKSTYDHALSAECDGNPHACTPQGAIDGRTAHAEAEGATASFIGAGVLVAGGAVLFFTTPNGARVAPVVGYRSTGVSLEVPW
jgi:hypothetical protein